MTSNRFRSETPMILDTLKIPIFAFCILTIGNALFTTVTPLHLEFNNIPLAEIGMIGSSYFIGLLFGALKTEKLIARIGFINAYVVFAICIAVSAFLYWYCNNTLAWIITRFLSGIATAGLFIIIESWCVILTDIHNRGKVMGYYHIFFYFASSAGQIFLILNIVNNQFFFFGVSALFCLMSILPLIKMRAPAPQQRNVQSESLLSLFMACPTSFLGAFTAGQVNAIIYSLAPLYIVWVKGNVGEMMAITILGAMAFQLPIGYLSDMISRAWVLLFIILGNAVTSWYLYQVDPAHHFKISVLLFIEGGFCFTLYAVAINLICERVSINKTVAAAQALLLSAGIGSSMGPTAAAILSNHEHLNLIFLYISAFCGISVLIVLAWKLFKIFQFKHQY